MTLLRPPTASFLKSKGRVATLGKLRRSPSMLSTPLTSTYQGMFIIDHFEVRDEGGEPVPLDEEAVCIHSPSGRSVAEQNFSR